MLHLLPLAHSEYRQYLPNGDVVPGTRALGHANWKGGGKLNPFGKAFRDAGYRWTRALCEADSDGDGEPNGLELGDPCCAWTLEGGRPPLRSWRISHPGCTGTEYNALLGHADVVCVSGMPMPNCSASAAATGRAAWELDARLADAQRLTQAAGWERFYYSNSFYASDFKKDLKLEPATWAVLLLPLAFAWLSRREARAAAKVSAEEKWLDGEDSDAARSGGRGFGASAAACAALLLAAFLYVDILSGFLHVVLDNPAFATWPLIGPGAVGFQRHHHHPMGITVYPLANFVQEHLGGMALFMATGLVPAKWSAGARTPELRLFLVVAVALSCAMMASHRWSHTMPSKLAPPVRWLQEWGVLLDHNAHSLHHVDYNMNFAIFSGTCNPALNFVTARLLSHHSRAWLGILLAWGGLPLAVGKFWSRHERRRIKKMRGLVD